MSGANPQPCRNQYAVSNEMIEAAIRWTIRVRFNTPDDKTRRAFEAWLRSDPRHAEAWRQMESAQKGFDVLPGPQAQTLFEKVEEKRRSRGISRRNAVKLAVLGGILLISGKGLQLLRPAPRETMTARTETGGRRTLRLSEGTVIELNTDTALRTEFTARQRFVHLLRGEILVATSKDADAASRRPFQVVTPFGPLEALGTRFAVRLMTDGVRLAVLEGAVRLGTPDGGAVAEAGTTWRWDAGGARRIPDAVQDAIDWLEDVIIAKNMPLSDLLAELSRYRAGEILWDPRVADLKVSGIYHTRDTDKALSILSQSLPVVLTVQTGNRIHIGPSRDTARHRESVN